MLDFKRFTSDSLLNLFLREKRIIREAGGGQPVTTVPEEVGVLVECIGEDEDEARAVAATAKQYLLHAPFPGRISTAGNLGFPFTPPEMTAGDAYRFSIYHIMEVDDLAPLFPVQIETIGG